MLFLKLIDHQWKEATRSSYWQKNVLINLMIGIFLIYFLINMIVLGVFLGRILTAAVPDSDPVVTLSGFLLFYFMADFLLRFLMQPAPVVSIVPYLHLPLKRNSIFHYLLIKSGLSLFNFFPLVLLVPFTIRDVGPLYNPGVALAWLMTIILLVFANNYLVFFFKKLFAVKPLAILLVLLVLAAFVWLDLSGTRFFSRTFGNSLLYIALHPGWTAVPVILLILSYGIAWCYLHHQRYMEVREKQAKLIHSTARSSFLPEKFGVTGTLVSLEIKMILRNNRPRSYLVLSLLFMFYGFMFYPRHELHQGDGIMLFIGLLLTGITMIQYGQLVLSWESSYFDRLCTAGFTTREFFAAKFWLFFIFNTTTFVITMPYALFDFNILLVNLVSWLFNCGVNIFIILFLGTFNTKRVDMSKGAFFNYEGVSAVHFIMILPVIGLPVLVYWLLSVATSPMAGLIAIGLAGLAGIMFHRQLINIVTRQFLARKQTIIHGFRNG